MTEKPAAPLIEADLQNPVSTTTLDVPASAAPKGARLPVDGNVSNAEFALAINSLRDTIEDISYALDRIAATEHPSVFARLLHHLYVELGVKVPPYAG